MHDHLGDHAKEEELDKANGEAEAGPVVAVLHDLQTVALEVDVAVKVHLVEGLHGNLARATVLGAVGILLEVEVVLDGATGVAGLLGLAGADGRDGEPPGGQQRQVEDQGEEDEGLETAAELPGDVERYTSEDGEEGDVVERVGPGAVGGQRRILDGRRLGESDNKAKLGWWSDENTLVVRTP